jgi:hypothetical protein
MAQRGGANPKRSPVATPAIPLPPNVNQFDCIHLQLSDLTQDYSRTDGKAVGLLESAEESLTVSEPQAGEVTVIGF